MGQICPLVICPYCECLDSAEVPLTFPSLQAFLRHESQVSASLPTFPLILEVPGEHLVQRGSGIMEVWQSVPKPGAARVYLTMSIHGAERSKRFDTDA